MYLYLAPPIVMDDHISIITGYLCCQCLKQRLLFKHYVNGAFSGASGKVAGGIMLMIETHTIIKKFSLHDHCAENAGQ